METVELSQLDCRLEKSRVKDAALERALLESISSRGILDPLDVVCCEEKDGYILVDGFKRYRCARKLGMGMVPARFIAGDIVTGILALIRRSNSGNQLSTLEQAALIEELHQKCGLSIYDIATHLGRSPSWVSMRLGMIEQLSPLVREKILSGAFPIRVYMYSLKRFTRVNRIPSQRVDTFVSAVSGKHLSTRELFVLSRCFFSGGPVMEDLILRGDIHRAVHMYTGCAEDDSALSVKQRSFISDMTKSYVDMGRVASCARDISYESGYFVQYVNFWAAKIRRLLPRFRKITRELYDKTRPPVSGTDDVSQRGEQKTHRQELSS
jgi:ParB/RepB/Spo0J family partition protein